MQVGHAAPGAGHRPSPHLVEAHGAEDLQLLVQVLAVRAHVLAELEAPLNVGRVDEVVHGQRAQAPRAAAPAARAAPRVLRQRRRVRLQELRAGGACSVSFSMIGCKLVDIGVT